MLRSTETLQKAAYIWRKYLLLQVEKQPIFRQPACWVRRCLGDSRGQSKPSRLFVTKVARQRCIASVTACTEVFAASLTHVWILMPFPGISPHPEPSNSVVQLPTCIPTPVRFGLNSLLRLRPQPQQPPPAVHAAGNSRALAAASPNPTHAPPRPG